MRLSGHIPRGLTIESAGTLGFDEFQHAAFLFSTVFQDSLYVPQMRAYSAVATAVAPSIPCHDMTAASPVEPKVCPSAAPSRTPSSRNAVRKTAPK